MYTAAWQPQPLPRCSSRPSRSHTCPSQTGQRCSHKSAGLPHCPSPRGRGHSQHQSASPQELDSPSHSSYSPGDEFRHAATHQGSESHQEQQAAAKACHYGTDPPLGAGDALEGGIAPTLLHHHHHLPTLIVNRIGAPPESAKGYRLA